MKTIYFVRHGQSQANVDRIYAPDDSPLTEKGRQQAIDGGKNLEEVGIQLIISSPLKRCQDTATLIAHDLDIDPESIETDDRLTEIKADNMMGTPLRGLPAFIDLMKDPSHPYDVESVDAVVERLRSLLSDLEQRAEDPILLVAHGGIGGILSAIIEGEKTIERDLFLPPNAIPILLTPGATHEEKA